MFARSPNVPSVSCSQRAPTLALLLASVGLATPALADVWSWNAGNGNWMTASNWSPGSVPGLDPAVFTDIRIGNLPGVQNGTVLMNQLPAFGSLNFDSLSISNGMTLDMNGRELGGLTGTATLTGAGSQLIVRTSSGPNFHDFTSFDMTMGVGTLLTLADDGRLRTGFLTSSGVISGRGTIHLQGGPGASLVNNGTIQGSVNGGLTLLQEGTGRLDLDGASGNGQLLLASPFSQLTIQGDTLADAFGGTVTMGSGSLLNMNMASGWTADANSTFNVSSSIAGAAAQINGGHFTLGGDLNIGGSQGHLRVLAHSTLTNTADVFLGMDDRLEFDGTAEVNGGTYELSHGSQINFDESTVVSGGTFSMAGPTYSDGVVNFNGDTEWNGGATFSGTARQHGNATVNSPTVINAGVFDMDGNSGFTLWRVQDSLTVNADRIDASLLVPNRFNGLMRVESDLTSRLTINLTDPNDVWHMDGSMLLRGIGALPVTRVAGSDMEVTGYLTVQNGLVQITANTSLRATGLTIDDGSTLRMRGATTVEAPTVFAGSGTLQNGVGGSMLLHSGVSLSQVGLANSGILRIGEAGPGVAAVDRLASASGATWAVDIGGYLAGTTHDLLLVSGGSAMLNGELIVSLLPGFAPLIGDEFTILSSLGGVSGAFSNDPTTFANGLTYDWTVVYNPNSVVLRLDNIVPTPGSLALLSLGGLLAVCRRRIL